MTAPFWLSAHDTPSIADRLRALGWLAANEAITAITPAGNGNVNLVLRVAAGSRTLILKQARPWVERFPTIAAPVERSVVEASFYQVVHDALALQKFMPRLLGVDRPWHILFIEDAGVQADPTTHYRLALADPVVRSLLIEFLCRLHALPAHQPALPDNRAMQTINHAHIFVLPFADADADLAATAAMLGARYLQGEGYLLHGDFCPDAWVFGQHGAQVIDPEFCLFGPAEFDLGVMAAHLLIAGGSASLPDEMSRTYQVLGGQPVDPLLVRRFAGVEIWRRLRGVAAVSLTLGDDQRAALIALAVRLMRQ